MVMSKADRARLHVERQPAEVLITDLDNTLYDWFEMWYHAFKAMLDRLVEDSGIPRERLLREAKELHQRHRTAEYAFLIEELPSLRQLHPGADLPRLYDGAIHAYRRARKQHLRLFPGVRETLRTLRERGTLIVAYTESMGFYSADRVRRLDLDGVIDVLYSPVDHELPPGVERDQARMYPPDHYGLQQTLHRHTPEGELKPNPQLLLDIIGDLGAARDEVIYVGDSLVKDVLMAQEAGVTDVYAAYGQAHSRQEYELLRAVTYWTAEQVERERVLSEANVEPTHTLRRGFDELLEQFDFRPFSGTVAVAAL